MVDALSVTLGCDVLSRVNCAPSLEYIGQLLVLDLTISVSIDEVIDIEQLLSFDADIDSLHGRHELFKRYRAIAVGIGNPECVDNIRPGPAEGVLDSHEALVEAGHLLLDLLLFNFSTDLPLTGLFIFPRFLFAFLALYLLYRGLLIFWRLLLFRLGICLAQSSELFLLLLLSASLLLLDSVLCNLSLLLLALDLFQLIGGRLFLSLK